MEDKKDYHIIDCFVLKIVAMICMTLDHIGVLLASFENARNIAVIFRHFGRLAFPIFIFLLVEGVLHTRNFWRYFRRIAIVEIAFAIGQLFLQFVMKQKIDGLTSPMMSLVVISLLLYFINRKDKYSYFAILPAIYSIICFLVDSFAPTTPFLPVILRVPYPLFGLLISLMFYYSNQITKLFLTTNKNNSNLIGTKYEFHIRNYVCAIGLFLISLTLYFLYLWTSNKEFSNSIQVYSLFAAIPIIFYSGKRGYNANWFKYGSYIYIPAHLIIIYFVFILILL